MADVAKNIMDSLAHGFLDNRVSSVALYDPKFLVNDYKKGSKVLTSIEFELSKCNEFYFSVAFITNSGVASLINILSELEKKNIKGKILTSQYQNFTEPVALRRLLALSNLEIKIATNSNLHAKGYIFRKSDSYSFIIGSSNLTQNALSDNKEWNLKVSSLENGEVMQSIISEFNAEFENATVVDEKWIDAYELIYKSVRQSQKSARDFQNNVISFQRINPNNMQKEALLSLQKLRDEGKDRALLISATGTGKTYLSAFDVAAFKPKRFLFVIHRENIARAAITSFKNVLGYNIDIGLLTGNEKNFDKQYTFCTIQTLSRDNIMERFSSEDFDYIVIDEVHRSGAYSYQKILNYFKPKFLLGMSATPERNDGINVFDIFNYNIAYEIRLQQALEEKMLIPFHYYGISEITVDGKLLEDNAAFNYLICNERVERIIEATNFYGWDHGRVKGLIFCSRVEESKELSNVFNSQGYYTLALDGSSSEDERENAIERLEQKERDGGLDYIFTVDIFNEGVDIPEINQIIMLRPTQSAIVFVQQLGRGLRKTANKEYVVVIDIIGNYKNNFLIPIALSGDRSYNKDTIRKYISGGSRVIPGCSTINFDEITRKHIFTAIDVADFNNARLIKDNYVLLKNKLGKVPSLMDFETYESIDMMRIFDKYGSYYNFLVKIKDKDYTIRLSDVQAKHIEFISKKLASGKRVHELEFLKKAIYYEHGIMSIWQKAMKEDYNINIMEKTVINVANVLTNEFATGSAKSTYEECVFIEKDSVNSDFMLSEGFIELLSDKPFYDMVMELINFGIYRNNKYYSDRYLDTNFQLYQKYTYEDVCRLLDWEKSEVALNIGGYKFDKKTKTYPVFINYEKSEEINASIAYEDRFLTSSLLIALSKSGRTVESEDVTTAYRAKELGVDMELFVRKNKDDKISKEFYYLGKINTLGDPKPVIMKEAGKKAVEIMYQLETPIREDIYEYITK